MIDSTTTIASAYAHVAPAPVPSVSTSHGRIEPESQSEQRSETTVDSVELSPEARDANESTEGKTRSQADRNAGDGSEESPREGDPQDRNEQEDREVRELSSRDREVRRHEQAHKAAGGAYAGAISYSFQTGPDGRRYAVGGSVPIDSSPVQDDPQATIAKMQQVRRAALAPADPSGADRQVAAKAQATEQEARAELAEQQSALNSDETDSRPTHDDSTTRSDPDAEPTAPLDATARLDLVA